MSSIRELYQRFRHLIAEGFKFLVVGAIGTVVTFGLANGLHDIGKYKAITVATIVATVVTYVGNKYWSFSSRVGQSTVRDTTMFFILNAIGLIIYYACIWLTQDVAGLSGKLWYNFALVVGTVLGTLFRFWSYRRWVWTAAEADGDSIGPAAEKLPSAPDGHEGTDGQETGGAGVWTGPRHKAPVGRQ